MSANEFAPGMLTPVVGSGFTLKVPNAITPAAAATTKAISAPITRSQIAVRASWAAPGVPADTAHILQRPWPRARYGRLAVARSDCHVGTRRREPADAFDE